jgi:hypothetical protein
MISDIRYKVTRQSRTHLPLFYHFLSTGLGRNNRIEPQKAMKMYFGRLQPRGTLCDLKQGMAKIDLLEDCGKTAKKGAGEIP